MRLPRDRGLLSKHVLHALQTGGSLPSGLWADHGPKADLLHDEDAQLTLWVLYELHYRGFDDAAGDLECGPRPARAPGRHRGGARARAPGGDRGAAAPGADSRRRRRAAARVRGGRRRPLVGRVPAARADRAQF